MVRVSTIFAIFSPSKVHKSLINNTNNNGLLSSPCLVDSFEGVFVVDFIDIIFDSQHLNNKVKDGGPRLYHHDKIDKIIM